MVPRNDPMEDVVQHTERTPAKVAAIDALPGTKRPRPDDANDADDEGERKSKRMKKMSARIEARVAQKLREKGRKLSASALVDKVKHNSNAPDEVSLCID